MQSELEDLQQQLVGVAAKEAQHAGSSSALLSSLQAQQAQLSARVEQLQRLLKKAASIQKAAKA